MKQDGLRNEVLNSFKKGKHMTTKTMICAVIASTALMGYGQPSSGEPMSKEQESQLQAIAYSATLAKFVSTNSLAFAAALAPDARERWLKEEVSLRVEGVQLLLPDFFKVAYTYNGSVAADTFCFGLYNPFYDHMLLCKAKNLQNTKIVDYKWVSGSELRQDPTVPKYPLATGTSSVETYFPALLKTAGDILSAFNRAFVGPAPDKAFSSMATLDKVGHDRLLDIAKLRAAQAVKMTGDKSAYGLATLSAAILADGNMAKESFVGSDKVTQATVKTLDGMPSDVRRKFRAIGYFEAQDEKCVLFYNMEIPTFLALAHTEDGNTVRLGMFDMRIADGWEKQVNR